MAHDPRRKTELRLFLSSTFRDLQSEREYLIKKVFQQIRTVCRSRGVTFTEVDLRWGLTDEQQRLGRIIRTCLEEIDRCQPFFLGIVGKRYGWTPEYHEVMMDPDIQQRYPWIDDISLGGGSLLEMEFTAGLMNGSRDTTFFYRRDDDVASLDNPERIDELVSKVRSSGMSIAAFKTPEELGELVRRDLLAMIDSLWPEGTVPSFLEREQLAHEAFAHSRRRAYIPNLEYLTAFQNWLREKKGPLLVSAESGMGKSALLAWLLGEHRRKNPGHFVIEHYVGCSDDSTDHLGFMRRVIGEIQSRYGLHEEIPSDADALEHAFIEWLHRVGTVEGFESDELIIALDAVDQFLSHSRTLLWLPEALPSQVRLVVSCRSGERLDRLRSREWEQLQLRELKEREREAIIARYLGEYHKALPSEYLQRIGRDEKSASPLFLRTLAEELRLYGEHQTIGETVERYLSVRNLEELFMKMLERMEQDFGLEVVRSVTQTLCVSRAGLTESHLLAASGVVRVELSMLLSALDYHLLRGNGRINFFHNYLRRAVEARYLSDPHALRNEHARLGSFFQTEFLASQGTERSNLDPFVVREMLYQFFMGERRDELREALLQPDVFDLMFEGETEYEFLRYWKSLEETDIAQRYIASFASAKDSDLSEDAAIDRSLKMGRLFNIVGVWDEAESMLAQAVSRCESLEDGLRSLRAWGAYGDILTLRGKHDAALEVYGKKREKALALGLWDVAAMAEGDIGSVLLERAEYDEATRRFETALEVAMRNKDKLAMARLFAKIGQARMGTGVYDKAMQSYKLALELFEAYGDKRGAAKTLGLIGLIHWNVGAFEPAMRCFRDEMECMSQIGDTAGYAMAAGKIGLVELDRGDLEQATNSFVEYLAITKELGYARGLGFAYGDIGLVHLRRGEYDAAMEYFDKGLAVHREINFPEGVAIWLRWKAAAALESIAGHLDNPSLLEHAAGWIDESLQIASVIGKPNLIFDAKLLRIRLDHLRGNSSSTIDALEQLLAEFADESKKAEVYYWIWKLSTLPHATPAPGSREVSGYKERALELYSVLSERSKKEVYLDRFRELSAAA